MAAQEECKDNEKKKILMICGDYGEDYETMVPFQTLSCAGYEVHAVCPKMKSGETIKTSIHDFEGAQTYSEKVGHNFALNYDFTEAEKNVKQYIGLVIPGGRAPEYLSIDKNVIALVKHFTDNDLPIAAVCHGPLILGAIPGYLKGKKATCYPACKPILQVCGANYQEAEPVTKSFTDGKLVTAAAWPAHPQWLSQFMSVLGCKITGIENKNVLLLAGDYVEDYEVMCVYQMLETFGCHVDTVCPDKNEGDYVKTSVHDFEGAQTYSEKVGHNFVLNANFKDVIAANCLKKYDALYIPGGRAPEYLSVNQKVIGMVDYFVKEKKVIASICHGQLILAATTTKCLNGRTCTAYPALEPIMKLCGAKWVKPEPVDIAVTDNGNNGKLFTLITGAAWPGHIEFVGQIIAALGGNIVV